MSDDNLVDLSTICSFLALKPRWVQELAKDGVLPKAQKGKYPLKACVNAYIEHLRGHAYGGKSSNETGYGLERTNLTRYKAEIAKIKLEQMRRESLPADDVKAEWTSLVAVFRARMLAIPSRIIPRLRGSRTNVEAKQLLEKQIKEALNELANCEITTPKAG